MIEVKEARSTYNRSSPVFSKAEGSWLLDDNGNKYLDCTAGSGAISIGHANPDVTETICSQARRLIHTGCKLQSTERSSLFSKLGELVWYEAPKVLPTVTGAEAVEAALKIARAHTLRKKIVAFNYSYHGKTSGALAVTWRESLKPYISEDKANTVFCPAPYIGLDWPCEVAQAIDHFNRTIVELDAVDDLPAAVIVEPIESTEGVLVIDPVFLKKVEEICSKHNVLLIFDEIYTGFGRTGCMFYAEKINIRPDLLIIGKGMANGLPCSAVIGEESVVNSLPEGMQTSTFSGGVLACATASTVIDIIQNRALAVRAEKSGERIKKSLEALSERGFFSKPRGSGLMIGFDCIDRNGLCDSALADKVVAEALHHGIVFFHGGYAGASVRLTPPLTISDEEISFLEEVLEKIHNAIIESVK